MKKYTVRLAMLGLALCAGLPLPASADLVLHYTFDKTDGKTVFDSSPYGNDGLVMGAVPVSAGVSGGAMRFDGVDDYIRVPRDPSLEPKEITVAAWVKVHRFRPDFGMLIHKRNGSVNNNEDYDLQVRENGTLRSVVANGAQTRLDSPTRIEAGAWHHVAMTFAEPVLKLYVDGVLAGVKSHPHPLAHNPKSDLLIGGTDHASLPMSLFLNCDVDEVQIYDTVLAASDIAKLAGTAEQGHLVLHYTFDKTDGKTVFDSSPYGNDGLVMGAVPVSAGVSGGAMRFDGVDDYIRVPRDPSLEPKEITVAAWVKVHRFRPDFGMLIHKRNGSINNNEDYDLQVRENGTLRSVVANGDQTRLDSSSRMDKGAWHHVAMTFAEPVLTLYVDGVLAGVTSHPHPLAHNPNSDLLIGGTDHASLPMDLFLNCDVDEVQIYDTVLAAPDIAKLAGTAEQGHLVLHYTFDKVDKEKAIDSSRFGNDGLLFGATPVAGGVSGGAMRFDGVDDYIRVPRDMSLEPAELTVAAWLRVNEFPADFALLVHKRNTSFHNNEAYDFQVWNDGTLRAVLANGAQTRLDSSIPIGAKKWRHVAMVFAQPELKLYVDGALVGTKPHPYPLLHNPDSDLLIGGTDHALYPMGLFLNCDLDELRIYNAPLSAAEIAGLAGAAAAEPGHLLLHYSFDKPEDGIVTDDSGNGRTAKVNGAMWVTNGARGGAYRFDNSNQTITASDAGLPTGDAPRSIAAWMKLDVEYSGGETKFLTYGVPGFNRSNVELGFDWRLDRDRVFFSPGGTCFLSDRRLPPPGTWVHVTYTYAGNGAHHLYLDGVPSDGMSELYGPVNTILSGLLQLGGHPESEGPDGGYIDDLRIYGRVLSAEEIAELALPDASSTGDLLVHYTFDQDEDGIVTDDSGNGRTAKVNGATWVTNGVRGGAYRFDDKFQTLTATDAGLPSGDAPRTLAAWMKLDASYSNGVVEILSYGTPGFNLNQSGLGFDWRLDRNCVQFSPGGSCFLSDRKLPPPGTWIHVAYTYEGNGAHHLFIDGQPADGMSELWGPVDTRLSGLLLLGGHPEAPGLDGGYLDEVRIYDYPLSAEDVRGLYAQEAPPPASGGDPIEDDSQPGLDDPLIPVPAEWVSRVRTTGLVGDSVVVSWSSLPGQTYELLWAADLTSGFTVIASHLVATGTEMSFTHSLGDSPVGFFSIRLQE